MPRIPSDEPAALWRRPLSRRDCLRAAALLVAASAWPRRALAADPPADAALASALAESPTVYISPLLADGRESRCHAEVWFVSQDGAVWVVTGSDRWRARAIQRGLDRARLWVGDFGVWRTSGERFRKAPGFVARGALVPETAAQQRALDAFGRKYAKEWGSWGPRFKKGLADGSRVLLRYTPAT